MADTQEQPTTQEAAVSQDAPTQPDVLEVPMNQQNRHHDEDAATEHEKQEQVQDSKEEQQVHDKKEEQEQPPQHAEDKKKQEDEQQEEAHLHHAETPTTPEQQDSQLVANQHVEHLPHDSTLGAQTTSTPQNQEYADLSTHATPVEEPAEPAPVPVEEPVVVKTVPAPAAVEEPVAVKTVPAPVPVEEVVAAVTPVEEPAVIATSAAVAPVVEPVAAKVTSSAASDLSELKIPDNIEVKTSVQVPPKVTPLRKTPSGVTEKMGESARQKEHEGSASAGSIAMQLISSLRATASEFVSLVLPGSPSFSFIGNTLACYFVVVLLSFFSVLFFAGSKSDLKQ